MVAQPVSTSKSNISVSLDSKSETKQINVTTAETEADMMNNMSNYPNQSQYHQYHHYINKKDRIIATSTSKTNLYIKGLEEDTTDKDLYDLCERFGEIKSTKAIIDKTTSKCKGYGFVDFKSQEDARKALSELKREQRDVQLAKQREQDPTNLYFANLPQDVDEEMLNNMLKIKFNAIVNSTRIMREKNGNSKGVGFARIDDDKLCDKIILDLNNQPFPEHINQEKLIMVKLADSCSIIKAPPPPSSFAVTSSKIYRQEHLQNTFSHTNSINSTGLDNSSSSFVSSVQNNTLLINDNNNNQYGISNLNLSHGFRQQHHSHQIYAHTFSPFIDYNNYQYAIMVDQNGGYMAPTVSGQHQTAAAGYNTNSIPLLKTPPIATTNLNTPSSTALLPQAIAVQNQQQTTTTSTPASSAPVTCNVTVPTLNSPAYTASASSTGSSRQQQQSYAPFTAVASQTHSNTHALIQHQTPHYFASHQPSSLTNHHNQISSHQMPYYIISNPYHHQTSINYHHSAPHLQIQQQLNAFAYQHSNTSQAHQISNVQQQQTNMSNTNTPSSTPISQSSSSLVQNMSNLSINSLATSKLN